MDLGITEFLIAIIVIFAGFITWYVIWQTGRIMRASRGVVEYGSDNSELVGVTTVRAFFSPFGRSTLNDSSTELQAVVIPRPTFNHSRDALEQAVEISGYSMSSDVLGIVVASKSDLDIVPLETVEKKPQMAELASRQHVDI